jgi:phospholipase/carboxylesterase
MLLYPGLTRRAVLLRPMLALEEPPSADLAGAAVLAVVGAADPHGLHAAALVEALRRAGASVAAETVATSHDLVRADADLVRAWLHAGTAR